MEMRNIKKLSNSSLDKLSSCPKLFFHSYLDPTFPEKKGGATFYGEYGTLLHFLAEFYPRTNHHMDLPFEYSKYTQGDTIDSALADYGNMLYDRGQPLTVDEMMAIYNEQFEKINFPDPEKQQEYFEQGVEFIKGLPDRDWSQVIALEQNFQIDLQNGSLPLNGVIDKIERDEKGLVITDYKTSKPYSKNSALEKSQLPIYGMACFYLYGELPYKYRYDFIRFGKTLEVEIPLERLTEVSNFIKFKNNQLFYFMNNGQFPANYTGFYCKNFCDYSYMCDTFKQFNP